MSNIPPAHLIVGTGTGKTPENPPRLRRFEEAFALHNQGQTAVRVEVTTMRTDEEEEAPSQEHKE